MKRAAFLDRDGVINRNAPEGDYIIRWEDMQILPGVAEALAWLNLSGFCTIVVTNQRCVAKGLITPAGVESLHRKMRESLSGAGATIDDIFYCPHESDAACHCRKPQPGMLLDAAVKHGVDLEASWMIGDSPIDVQAGATAGCRTALVVGSKKIPVDVNADVVATSLLDAVQKILNSSEFKNRRDAS